MLTNSNNSRHHGFESVSSTDPETSTKPAISFTDHDGLTQTVTNVSETHCILSIGSTSKEDTVTFTRLKSWVTTATATMIMATYVL
jgi:hypothetical protein